MAHIEKDIEVDAPLRTVYNQWTQFEDWPQFMGRVKEVRQIDDTHLHWIAKVGGKTVEWDAEITEQVPDTVIAWRSVGGEPNGGRVIFEPGNDGKTRVCLRMDYEPQGAVEKVGDALGVTSASVARDLKKFKTFVEKRGRETGQWRGEVHGAQTTRRARDARR